MGGTVAETIRLKNGDVIKMARKTGAYNWMFFSEDFITGKIDKAIEEHVKIFNEMREDFLSGKPYKLPMSGVYGWCQETAPVDYGLVVIDFKNEKIHSFQGYDTPYSSLMTALRYSSEEEKKAIYKGFLHNSLNVFYDDQLIGDINSFVEKLFDNQSILKKITKSKEKLDENDVMELFSRENIRDLEFLKNKKDFDIYDLRLRPKSVNFQIIKYEEGFFGGMEMLKNLLSEGFIFNEEEKKQWKYFLFEDKDYESFAQEDMEHLNDDEFEKYCLDNKNKLIIEFNQLFDVKKSNNKKIKS